MCSSIRLCAGCLVASTELMHNSNTQSGQKTCMLSNQYESKEIMIFTKGSLTYWPKLATHSTTPFSCLFKTKKKCSAGAQWPHSAPLPPTLRGSVFDIVFPCQRCPVSPWRRGETQWSLFSANHRTWTEQRAQTSGDYISTGKEKNLLLSVRRLCFAAPALGAWETLFPGHRVPGPGHSKTWASSAEDGSWSSPSTQMQHT